MSTATTVVTCPNCGHKNRVPASTSTSGTPRCGNCQQRLPWIAEADDASFEDVADKAEVPVLVDLWAPWCVPCNVVTPALEKLAAEKAGQLKLVKVDVDTSPRVAQRFDAWSIPTLLVMWRGDVIARRIGAAAEAALRAWLDEALPPAEPAPGTSSS